jgi:thioredoxin 1
LSTNNANTVEVLRFTATWCMPCKAMAPIVEQLSKEFETVQFRTVDADQEKELFKEHKVTAVPTIVFLKNNVEQKRMVGLQNKSAISSCIKNLL